jgi:hypothetical protein
MRSSAADRSRQLAFGQAVVGLPVVFPPVIKVTAVEG